MNLPGKEAFFRRPWGHFHGEDAVGEALRAENLHVFEIWMRASEVERIEKPHFGCRDGRFLSDRSRLIRHREDEILRHQIAPAFRVAVIHRGNKVDEKLVDRRQIIRTLWLRPRA